MVEPGAVNAAVRALFLEPRVREILVEWWQAEILTPVAFELSWRLGLESYIDNHEEALLHTGRVERSHQAADLAGRPPRS